MSGENYEGPPITGGGAGNYGGAGRDVMPTDGPLRNLAREAVGRRKNMVPQSPTPPDGLGGVVAITQQLAHELFGATAELRNLLDPVLVQEPATANRVEARGGDTPEQLQRYTSSAIGREVVGTAQVLVETMNVVQDIRRRLAL